MAAKKPRRFEFREKSSNKFWEVSTSGKGLTTRWGKLGTDGQSKAKQFASPGEAEAEAARLINDKLEEGYSEAEGSGPTPKANRPIDPKVAASVQASWKRIDGWLTQHAPSLMRKVGKKATWAAIAKAEAALGVELPDDVRASYLIHDGSDFRLFPSGDYMTLAGIVNNHKMWRQLIEELDFDHEEGEPKGPIRRVHYHPRWVPLTSNGGGDHTLIDLAPAKGGKVGQLIDFSHETGPEQVAARSLAEYLSALADALEAGSGPFKHDHDLDYDYLDWQKGGTTPRSAFPKPPKKSATKKKEEAGMSAKRYFEFTKGTSSKFWEVFHEGSVMTTRYGKIGTPGRSTSKSYDSPAEAADETAKIIAKKVEEGYAEKR